jgi:hypothetical protein
VAHTCNRSYSGGKDQEEGSLKPVQANSFSRPYLEKTLHIKRLVNSSSSTGKKKVIFSCMFPGKKKCDNLCAMCSVEHVALSPCSGHVALVGI